MLKYYVVCSGRKLGIFDTWTKCNEQIQFFKHSMFKSFTSLERALIYIGQEMPGGEKYVIQIHGRDDFCHDYNIFVDRLEKIESELRKLNC